jgi:hypothetical protein
LFQFLLVINFLVEKTDPHSLTERRIVISILTSFRLLLMPAMLPHLRGQSPYTLTILEDTDREHADGGYPKQSPSTTGTGNILVEDIDSSQGLHDKGEQVPKPEPAVRNGVGGDAVRTTQMHQKERCPERHELVLP